jgi:rRNA maturation protein Nop10
MSDTKKPDGVQEYSPNPVAELPTKQYRPSDFDLEQMYQEYRRGKTLGSIAEKFNLSDKTVGKYRKELKWDERRAKEVEEKQKLERSEIEDIAKETYSKLLKVTYKLVSDFERYVFDGEEQGSPVPLKVLTEAVEKLTKLHYFAANGGVERTKTETVSRNVHERIDYAELARIHLEAKKNPQYDEKALLKDVVDASYKKSDKK